MRNLNAWIFGMLFTIAAAVVWLGVFSSKTIHPQWIFSEKKETIATIDSVVLIHGMRGQGFNQSVYYQFNVDQLEYRGNYQATQLNSGPVNVGDRLRIKYARQDPTLHEIVGYYKRGS